MGHGVPRGLRPASGPQIGPSTGSSETLCHVWPPKAVFIRSPAGLPGLDRRAPGQAPVAACVLRRRMCNSRSCFVDHARCLGQQALGALGLGEGDHVTDGLGTGHHGDEAVQAEGQAAVRGAPYCSASSRKPNLACASSGVDLQGAEHLCSEPRRGGCAPSRRPAPSRSAPCRSLGHAGAGIGVHQVLVAVLGAVKGGGRPSSGRLPRRARTWGSRPPTAAPGGPRTGRAFAEPLNGRSSGAARRWRRSPPWPCRRRRRSGRRLARRCWDLGNGGVVEVLDDGRLQAVTRPLADVVDLDPGQALGAVDLDELGVGVDLAADIRRRQGTRRATTRPPGVVAAR